MNKADILSNWLKKAGIDYKLIKKELSTADPIFEAIAFHLQQYVEKYLKAYLVSKDIESIKTHNIAYLINECIKIDEDFKAFLQKQLTDLTIYGVGIRYPDNVIEIDQDEIKQSLEHAITLASTIEKKLKTK